MADLYSESIFATKRRIKIRLSFINLKADWYQFIRSTVLIFSTAK